MTEQQILYAHVGSNVVALLMLLACWRGKNLGRVLFVALFLWAGQLNLRTALTQPQVYLAYAQFAVEPYRSFIQGLFAGHVTTIVGTIATGQLLIGLLVALRGLAVRLGLVGAIVFLVAIAPLGVGSAFPATLLMAVGAFLLFRANFPRTLPTEVRAQLRGSAPRV